MLKTRCVKTAVSIYGDPLPSFVLKRMTTELNSIRVNKYASHYIIASDMTGYSREAGYEVTNRGMLSSSLVTFLSCISEVNPLPAHYSCPNCHHFELAPKKQGNYRVCGYDLPDRQCPKCGSVMIADGADILSEVNTGLYLDREPDVILNFSPEIRNEIIEFIKQKFISDRVYRAGVKAELPDGSIKRNVHPGGIYIIPGKEDISDLILLREPQSNDKLQLKVTEEDYHKLDGKLKKYDVLALPELGLLHDLESETGTDKRGIRFNDDEILRVFLDVDNSFMRRFSNLYKEIIQEVKPRFFSDLARIDGLVHGAGTWSGNGYELIKDGKTVREIISCRDDVMQYLMSMGVSKGISYKAMEYVRTDKGLTDDLIEKMISAGIPDWYIDSCNKIRYVYPWAQCVEYTLMNWRLAYYWLHYPDAYNALYERYYCME